MKHRNRARRNKSVPKREVDILSSITECTNSQLKCGNDVLERALVEINWAICGLREAGAFRLRDR